MVTILAEVNKECIHVPYLAEKEEYMLMAIEADIDYLNYWLLFTLL